MLLEGEIDLVDYMEWTSGVFTRLTSGIRRRLDNSVCTMTERRVLRAVLQSPDRTDAEIAATLAIASSQLSRTVTALIGRGLIEHQPSSKHKRQRLLRLTQQGTEITEKLDAESKHAFAAQLEAMPPREQKIIMDAWNDASVRRPVSGAGSALELRVPNTEDLAWLFAQLIIEGQRRFQWGSEYIAYVAEVFRAYATRLHEDYPAGWIAYRHGRRAGGCLMTYGADPLRSGGRDSVHGTLGVIFVAPRFRNIGIGSRLLEACMDQARQISMLSLLATAAKRQKDLHYLLLKFKFEARRVATMDFRYGPKDEWRQYVANFGMRRPGRPPLKPSVSTL